MNAIPSFTTKNLFADIAKSFAGNLINHRSIIINGIEAHFTDLEFYFFDPESHPDPFVHRHKLQNESNSWYMHTYSNSDIIKKGTRKGIDLCLGRENSFWGILIRGLRIDKEYINGPSRVVDKILSLIKLDFSNTIDASKKLGNAEDQNSLLFIRKNNTPDNFQLLNAVRVGLKIDYSSEEFSSIHQEAFITCKYRFIAQDPGLFQSNLAGKEKIIKESGLSDHEVVSLLGYNLKR